MAQHGSLDTLVVATALLMGLVTLAAMTTVLLLFFPLGSGSAGSQLWYVAALSGAAGSASVFSGRAGTPRHRLLVAAGLSALGFGLGLGVGFVVHRIAFVISFAFSYT